jgi:hypothetical protein
MMDVALVADGLEREWERLAGDRRRLIGSLLEHDLPPGRIEAVLEQIEAALVAIDDGTYGLCCQCREPISAIRLRALPHATTCGSCARGAG